MLPAGYLYVRLMAAWLMIIGIVCLLFDKGALFLPLNHFRSEWLDYIVSFFNYFGSGWAIILVTGYCWCKGMPKDVLIQLLLSFLIASLFTCIMKNTIDAPRPALFFSSSGNEVLTAQWIKLCYTRSFPSGHTATAFAMATVAGWYSKTAVTALLWFLLACLAGYARIYLGQHFLEDVYGGSICGAMAAVCTIALYRHISKYRNYMIRPYLTDKEYSFDS